MLCLLLLFLLTFSIVWHSAIFGLRLQSHGSSVYGSRCLSPLACTYTFQVRFNGLKYVQHQTPECFQSMSVLRQAVKHSGCLQEPVSSRIAALAQSQFTCSAASAVQQRLFTGSSSCQSPVHIEDEPYCRQRQLIVLGNRVPELAPDSWVAPNAVVIGDVDIFDKVWQLCERSCHCVKPLSAQQWHILFSINTHTPDIFANPNTAVLCYSSPGDLAHAPP